MDCIPRIHVYLLAFSNVGYLLLYVNDSIVDKFGFCNMLIVPQGQQQQQQQQIHKITR